MSIQSTIQSKLPSLPPASARVGMAIIADPSRVLNHTISELAQLCKTSDPSVVRFCQAIGFSGYAGLRLALATELGREGAAAGEHPAPQFGGDLNPGSTLAETVARIRFTETMGIEETTRNLDLAVLEQAVAAVSAARRINLYGVGSGTVVAEDLRYKLFRIGLTVNAFPNFDNALMGASLMGPEDVAIAFSHGGETASVVDFLRMAKARGATTLVITNVADSTAARIAALHLLTVVRETPFRAGAMASRISQLAVVDCLFVGIAQQCFDGAVNALEVTHQAVRGPGSTDRG
ncbi:DNA-binding transcriptional regulator, MurR/RpiR family, contains HTH and SIS domains [Arthrobacter alpinus]|uniref:DNA-binding transcriptional regulator, MurR/RpiR family, contains HTH and SIS domains n=1 Tax=Arthrobacter alpinus TaxID=656366 RepID=A0A1H5KWQ6_9MICC|nr:MurR/RpiR family transcriptional regulator [Arthrobacter alpinus]SEE69245.1 DNA-binding transcriptional regulator, MurR/RpiR family, contains HTH and SIS domains [Arthrobacter alpinus]